jgi:hypothetical protein
MPVIAALPVAFQLSCAVSGAVKSAVIDTELSTDEGAELVRALELASVPRPPVLAAQLPGYVPSASRQEKSAAATPLGRACWPHQVWQAPSRHSDPLAHSLSAQHVPRTGMHWFEPEHFR